MLYWQDDAVKILREALARALETCDPTLHEATLNVIGAMTSEGECLPADLQIYRMIMTELYGTVACRSDCSGASQSAS